MNLKFHMQHDQAPKLQNSKIESGGKFKMAADTRNSKTYKIGIFSKMAGYTWLKFCLKYKHDLDVDRYQNEKNL